MLLNKSYFAQNFHIKIICFSKKFITILNYCEIRKIKRVDQNVTKIISNVQIIVFFHSFSVFPDLRSLMTFSAFWSWWRRRIRTRTSPPPSRSRAASIPVQTGPSFRQKNGERDKRPLVMSYWNLILVTNNCTRLFLLYFWTYSQIIIAITI